MTSEARPADPPPWAGDVGLGVDAWIGGVASSSDRESAPSSDLPSSVGPVEEDTEADHESVARKILLDQLTGQARTRHELAAKLRTKGVPEELSARLLDRFEEVGLINDEAFARLWIDSRQPGKGLGRRALAQELRRKGVDDEVARAALEEIDPDDEEAAARSLVRKKTRGLQGVDRAKATRRLVGMLARKGHAPGLAWRVVREELREMDDAAEPDLDLLDT